MKKFLYILSIFSLMILTGNLNGQTGQTFSSKDLITISQRADSLISLYAIYSTFSKDAMSINESYVDGFKKLFLTQNTLIYNDLDLKEETPSNISIDTYIKYIRAWYGTGLGVDLRTLEKKSPNLKDGKVTMQVTIEKSLLGFYKDQAEYRKKVELIVIISFDQKLRNFKIESIDHPDFWRTRIEATNQYINAISRGDKLFEAKDYSNAKMNYEQALQFKPDEIYPTNGIKKCNIFIEQAKLENRKPIFIDIHVLPSFTSAKLTGITGDNVPTNSSKLAFGFGVGFEYGLIMSKKGILSIGLAFDYQPYKSEFNLSNHYDTISTIDRDGSDVVLHNLLNDINEVVTLSMFEIPIYAKYKFLLSGNFNLYIKAGVKMGFMIGKKYNSSAMGEYSGQYPDFNDIILYGNELAAYGYGSYAVSSGEATINNLKGLNFSGFGGLGLGYGFGKAALHLGVNYTNGFSSLSADNSDYKVSVNNSGINSLTGLGITKTSAFSIEIGLEYKIN